jgi:hypothetical protein
MSDIDKLRRLQGLCRETGASKSEVVSLALEMLLRAPDEAIETALRTRRVRSASPSFERVLVN